ETVPVFDRHPEPLHERSRIFPESLLRWYERIAMVGVLDRSLFEIAGDADVVVRSENHARAFAGQELADGLDLFTGGFLFGDHVVKTEDHHRVGVFEDAFIKEQFLSSLVDALIDSDGVAGDFTDEVLESQQREVEELESSSDSL